MPVPVPVPMPVPVHLQTQHQLNAGMHHSPTILAVPLCVHVLLSGPFTAAHAKPSCVCMQCAQAASHAPACDLGFRVNP